MVVPLPKGKQILLGAHPLPWEASVGGGGTTSGVSDGTAVALADPPSTAPWSQRESRMMF